MQTLDQLKTGSLLGTKHLKISEGLEDFPDQIFELQETLEILDLSGNHLRALPPDFGKLKYLKILFMSDNLFTTLPDVLSDCKSLEMIGFKSNKITRVGPDSIPENTRWLILTNNQIEELPASIGNCKRLQKVALAGNRLKTLPSEMSRCHNLELLRISANCISELTPCIVSLPRLSWLAFSGNPFCLKKNPPGSLKLVDWNEFKLLEQLGEGASGNIFKTVWCTQNDREVAIKIFKGEVTSDGLPEDEISASISAGEHVNFVSLFGQIKNHPQKKQGLIMSLIAPAFRNLGMPPDFKTCTRDTFTAETTFTSKQVVKIISAIASAVKHLHEKGIMHGDLYAHNILIDGDDNCLLTDFGAATFYLQDEANAQALQKIEVRALGCLLDDLLSRLDETEEELAETKILSEIRNQLLSEDPAERPLFEQIAKTLSEL